MTSLARKKTKKRKKSSTGYARRVYDFERGIVFDRTKAKFPGKMKYDIDFKCKDAPNPTAHDWTYGGSAKTIEHARAAKKRIAGIGKGKYDCKTRIVDAFTGKIIK